MPEPVSRYQAPLACRASMPAAFHSCSSAVCVPLLSPREANGAFASAILLQRRDASSCRPIARPDPHFGPTTTKSLYITSNRLTPSPSATNFSSAALVVDEQHVGIAVAARSRSPGRCRARPRAPRCRSPSRTPAAGSRTGPTARSTWSTATVMNSWAARSWRRRRDPATTARRRDVHAGVLPVCMVSDDEAAAE